MGIGVGLILPQQVLRLVELQRSIATPVRHDAGCGDARALAASLLGRRSAAEAGIGEGRCRDAMAARVFQGRLHRAQPHAKPDGTVSEEARLFREGLAIGLLQEDLAHHQREDMIDVQRLPDLHGLPLLIPQQPLVKLKGRHAKDGMISGHELRLRGGVPRGLRVVAANLRCVDASSTLVLRGPVDPARLEAHREERTGVMEQRMVRHRAQVHDGQGADADGHLLDPRRMQRKRGALVVTRHEERSSRLSEELWRQGPLEDALPRAVRPTKDFFLRRERRARGDSAAEVVVAGTSGGAAAQCRADALAKGASQDLASLPRSEGLLDNATVASGQPGHGCRS
eukprot:scaffold357_cov239-Pinguiococcus_pyrenoidosus.AAC.13